MTNCIILLSMKEIVDAHFLENHEYYKKVCRYSFKDRYLWEDLLQETYLCFLRVKPDTIEKYHELGKLRSIGNIIIRSLYQDRKRAKKNKNGHTSPLFEFNSYSNEDSNLQDSNELNYFEIELYELEMKVNYDKALVLFDKALTEPVSDHAGASSFLKIKTFLAVQDSNIYRISKQTGINRKYITDVYNEAREYIKKEIAK